jgi:predicted  nucleic acid-binding Zn-ribbon protein
MANPAGSTPESSLKALKEEYERLQKELFQSKHDLTLAEHKIQTMENQVLGLKADVQGWKARSARGDADYDNKAALDEKLITDLRKMLQDALDWGSSRDSSF